ncbi:DNA-deoxyinosine glycosylase [Myroides odoratus]|uniref:DNA-deoxyinosine glycosylase n=1 Tax=Myroides odoratus TaxID=256 RepID=UPI0039B00C30
MKEKNKRIQSFQPLLSSKPKVLILGTMPSVKSLEQQEYYGNKQNVFWKLMFTVAGQELPATYAEKITFIHNNHLALWDVLQSCERQGSLDSEIKEEVPNAIRQLLQEYPSIHTLVFSSQKAAQYFKKYIGQIEGIQMITMPSPSGANARMSFAQKLDAWRGLTDLLQDKKTD